MLRLIKTITRDMQNMSRSDRNFTQRFINGVSLGFTLELISLNLFLFFLPLLEAPKNIFGVLYIISATINLYSSKRWSGSTRRLFFLTVLVILATLLAGVDSDILSLNQSLRNSLNWLMTPILCSLFLARSYSSRERSQFLYVFCIAIIVAILEATYQNTNSLRSVGHPNQSGLFAVTAYVVLLWLLMSQKSLIGRIIPIIALSLTVYFIFKTTSLLAIGLLFITTLSWLLLKMDVRKLNRANYFIVFAFIAINIAIFSNYSGDIQEKIKSRLESPSITSHRIELFNSYRLFLGDHVLLGWGVGSFKKVVTLDRVKTRLSISTGDQWRKVAHLFHFSNHAHNLYGHVLIERGLIGLILILAYVVGIIRELPAKREWPAIIPLLIIFFVGGLFQTTIHVEHGILGVWALCLMGTHSIGERS